MMNDNQHIPTGYKPSPLGIIPEDWEVKRLGDIAEITSGTTPSRDNRSFYSNGTIPWVKTTDLNNGVLNKTEELVTEAAIEQTSLKVLPTGTVLVAMYGGFNQIGRTALLGMDATINQALSALVCKQGVFNSYVLAWLNCKVGDWKRLAASSRKDPNITGKDVERFPILVPKMEEQQRIVSVLSLWDTAIAKQTALIEQLTLRKRGLMQQLLTGKKRLKGFEGSSFKMMSFDKIANTINVKAFQISKSDYQEKGKTPIVDQGQMFIAAYSDSDKIFTNVPFILFGDHTRIIKWIDFPCIIGADGVQAIKPKEEIDIKYLYYLLSNTELPNLGYSRHMSILKEKVFYVSTDIDEQKAIAECLSNADKEIEIQKQKLAAMQEQKKGLMQVLLTGKRRINQ